MAKKGKKLPLGVGCLAFFLLIGSIGVLITAVMLVLHRYGTDYVTVPRDLYTDLEKAGKPLLFYAVMNAAIGLPTGIGLYAKKYWAYCTYTIMSGVHLGIYSIHLYVGHDATLIINIFGNLLVLFYMFLPSVRKVFN